jgi:hypothetical protein
LLQDLREKIHAYLPSVRIRNWNKAIVIDHIFVVGTGIRSLESQFSEPFDQLSARDWG